MKKFYTLIAILSLFIISCTNSPKRVACIGDSITEGYGIKIQSKSSYPVVLDSILGDGYTVLNLGRSATNIQKTADFPYWIAKEFSNVFAFNPEIIVIKLGTNDTKPYNWNAENYEKDYQSMIDTFKTIPTNPEIFLCYPVPVYFTHWGINDSTITTSIIPIIDKLAEKNQLKIIDLYNGINNHADYFPDGIHPTEPAVKDMAKIVADEILK